MPRSAPLLAVHLEQATEYVRVLICGVGDHGFSLCGWTNT